MAAAANLTLRDELFYRVVPPDQSFTENYAGSFFFDYILEDNILNCTNFFIYAEITKVWF